MANIMSQVKLKNHTSRDGFDLSRKNAFTAKVGELLPVACIECIPGDKIKARVQHFTRTMPVSTAAYTRVREYYDWFFVPTNLLWNKFNSFVTQMVDNNQHAISITDRQVLTDMHPYFTTNQLHDYIRYKVNPTSPDSNYFGFNRGECTAKLLNYLGYGDFAPSTIPISEGGVSNPYRENLNLNPFPLLAYQKIYQDFFRHSQWENAYAPAFNIDYISGAASSLNLPISNLNFDLVHENMFDLRYCNWNKDLFMGLLPQSQYGDVASIVEPSTLSPYASYSNFPFNVYYGIEDDGEDINFNNVSVVEGVNKAIIGINAGNSSDIKMNGMSIAGKPTKISSYPTANQLLKLKQYISSADMQRLAQSIGISSGGSFTILALRQAEALQKWKEVTQSQQQDYKNQIEAHFGVSPSDAYSERCKWIEGSVSNLDISEVTNQNLTAENSANIAGKGVGVGDGNMNFSTDVHGYLMCIYHAVPLLDYSITGVNRMNLKTKVTDYAIPEFDQTGMVSVPLVELTNNVETSAFTADLLGYAPRYYDYKQAIDEVHGAFRSDLSPWVAPVDDSYITTYLNGAIEIDSLNYVFFKVNPATLNPIFGYEVDSSVDSDQLLVNAAFDISAVRNLDRNGLPY